MYPDSCNQRLERTDPATMIGENGVMNIIGSTEYTLSRACGTGTF